MVRYIKILVLDVITGLLLLIFRMAVRTTPLFVIADLKPFSSVYYQCHGLIDAAWTVSLDKR